MNNIETITKNGKCTGCCLCEDVCRSGAIKLEPKGIGGFILPSVELDTCVSCGQCLSKCPAFHHNKNETAVKGFYGIESAYQSECSSGGAFKCLAIKAIHMGWHVCGATFDDNLCLHHQLVSDEGSLQGLLKSKYIQSDCRNIYSKIQDTLMRGTSVLFCGTPLQMSTTFLHGKVRTFLHYPVSSLLHSSVISFLHHSVRTFLHSYGKQIFTYISYLRISQGA